MTDATTVERNRNFEALSVVHFSGHTAPHDILWWYGAKTEEMATRIGRSCNIAEKKHWDIVKKATEAWIIEWSAATARAAPQTCTTWTTQCAAGVEHKRDAPFAQCIMCSKMYRKSSAAAQEKTPADATTAQLDTTKHCAWPTWNSVVTSRHEDTAQTNAPVQENSGSSQLTSWQQPSADMGTCMVDRRMMQDTGTSRDHEPTPTQQGHTHPTAEAYTQEPPGNYKGEEIVIPAAPWVLPSAPRIDTTQISWEDYAKQRHGAILQC